jgi:hypothetical protein
MEAAGQDDFNDDLRDSTCTIDSTSSAEISPLTPVTPTFSIALHGHQRGSSSTSSLELVTPASSQVCPPSIEPSRLSGKALLADVLELEEPGPFIDDVASDNFDLYDSLCKCLPIHNSALPSTNTRAVVDEPGLGRDPGLVQSTPDFCLPNEEVDYDLGCRSDSDFRADARSAKKSRGVAGITQRLETRFPPLKRWKSKSSRSRSASVTTSPISEFGFDQRQALSRGPSSRSSSLSASCQWQGDRMNEPPLPPTPARSFYESTESIVLPVSVDVDSIDVSHIDPLLIERERALATTPLLPPFMNSRARDPPILQPSPLESPAVVSYSIPEATSPLPTSPLPLSPALSTRPSISSFHRMDLLADLPDTQKRDAWSDRLGHANFFITPEPYSPDVASVESLRELRKRWETAQTAYMKHLARTGEHYTVTSKTYALTEAKWAEIDRKWRMYHDETAAAIVASGAMASLEKFDLNATVPLMDNEGKFPERGDVDIVGPMVRQATMTCDGSDKKIPGFWHQLADRVRIRK